MDEFMNIPWARFAFLFLCLYLLFCGLAWLFADRMLFPVPRPSSYDTEFSNLVLELEDGEKIHCLHLQSENPSLSIIYSHGNGEDIGMLEDLLQSWKEPEWEIIAFDYPGYGLSEGKPSESGCYEAISVVYEHLVDTLNRDPGKVIAWGRSLGTGPTTYLAEKKQLGGMILESPFLSAFRSVTQIPFFPWDRFPNHRYAEKITCSSLVIHGYYDEVIPYRQGVSIFKALGGPKKFLKVEEGEHNNLPQAGGELYASTIRDFLKKRLGG